MLQILILGKLKIFIKYKFNENLTESLTEEKQKKHYYLCSHYLVKLLFVPLL